MAKHSIQKRETEVSTKEGVGKQLESTLTVDDNLLPSPQDLSEYKEINPEIVQYWLKLSENEQNHRHFMEKEKIKILGKSGIRNGRMNWWGMFFAFLSVIVLVTLSAYALYLDKPWFAGIMGTGTMIAMAAIFVNKGEHETKGRK